MVVLVLLGLLAAIAVPYMARDKRPLDGKEFVQTLARDLQRARIEAVTERLPMRAFVFRDRVELRRAIPGIRPGESPRAATWTDPLLRVLLARPGVDVWDVLPAASPPGGQVLSTTTYRTIEFNSRGQAQLVGQPALTPAFVYVRNTQLASSHPDRDFRIDVVPLTAAVTVRSGWN